ncbi:serine hydrolase domain-containing protein [Sandarakinorhabdus rubra]|uniref:serine hydrolase domain-containing protein n=1 Tax=Sandarakinorhabdus rubra TaxID=2672568 RepID=UPI0013DB5BDB|nr:serine hydrolase domain-containing protein [Sandarakinorhabdus rubra]
MTSVRRILLMAALLAAPATAEPLPPELATRIDEMMQDQASINNWPGIAWGIVKRGEGLVHAGHSGIADVASDRKVAADTRFRIASMTKAFTALTIHELAAEGNIRLDDPVVKYVPEMAGWGDALTITDLVHHMAGFVTDDPWGDRQTPLPEAEFTAFLKAGVPFTRAPGLTHEYSNLGYAILGRIIRNVTGQPFEAEIARRRFQPLGMGATTFNLADVPQGQLATGWRWEDQQWKREPDMGPGTFGAMGGVITTVPDYARWIDHLLSAWPAAAPGTAEPKSRATVRSLARGEGSPRRINRPGNANVPTCMVAVVYGGGLRVGDDCQLGRVAFHGGGYPGYGSHMVFAPDSGWGVFVFANHTYANTTGVAWAALTAIKEAGLMKADIVPLSPALARLVDPMHRIFTSGDVNSASANLAVNFLMDRDAAHRTADIAAIKAKSGPCPNPPGVRALGALEGEYLWHCKGGTLIAHALLAPTPTPQIQALDWDFKPDRR